MFQVFKEVPTLDATTLCASLVLVLPDAIISPEAYCLLGIMKFLRTETLSG